MGEAILYPETYRNQILNATNNWWGSEDRAKILQAVKATEGSVNLQPFIVAGDISSDIDGPTETTSTAVIQVDRFQNCSHLNFCSRRGSCIGKYLKDCINTSQEISASAHQGSATLTARSRQDVQMAVPEMESVMF